MNSTLDFKGCWPSDGASPTACHSLNISLYPVGAKEGAALGAVAGAQSLESGGSSQLLPHSALPTPPPRSSSFTPPFCSPPGSLETCWPPTPPPPQSPVRGGVHPCSSPSPAEAALKAMVWVMTSTGCFATLYFTMFVSSHIYPSSPLSIRQYMFFSDSFQSKLYTSVYFPSSTCTFFWPCGMACGILIP